MIEQAPCDDGWYESLHAPRDAAARRAHYEQTERFNAFHDGLDSPEIRAAIGRAREKALGATKARKRHDDKVSDRADSARSTAERTQ